MYSHRHVICICVPNIVVISRSSVELHVTSIFSRWPPTAILDLISIMLDHTRSAIAGLSSNLVLVRFILLEIERFLYLPFWLEIVHSRPFLGSFSRKSISKIHFYMVTHRSNHQKDHPCAFKPSTTIHVVSAIKRENRSSHKVVIFCSFGEKPPLNRLKPKFAWRVISPTLSRVQSFKMEFYMGGRISHFLIDFCIGLTTVQRDCAACDCPL